MSKQYVCVAVHVVSSGDTLYSISQQHDVPVKLLMQVNGIRNPYNLQIGAKLCIPGIPEENWQPGDGARDPSRPDGPRNPGRPDKPGNNSECKKYHRVVKGDTLYMIAKQHKVSLEDLIQANPDVDLYNLRIGTDLCVPY